MTKSYEFMGFGPFYVHMVEISKLTPASPFFFFNFGVPCPSTTKQPKKKQGSQDHVFMLWCYLDGSGTILRPTSMQ